MKPSGEYLSKRKPNHFDLTKYFLPIAFKGCKKKGTNQNI